MVVVVVVVVCHLASSEEHQRQRQWFCSSFLFSFQMPYHSVTRGKRMPNPLGSRQAFCFMGACKSRQNQHITPMRCGISWKELPYRHSIQHIILKIRQKAGLKKRMTEREPKSRQQRQDEKARQAERALERVDAEGRSPWHVGICPHGKPGQGPSGTPMMQTPMIPLRSGARALAALVASSLRSFSFFGLSIISPDDKSP